MRALRKILPLVFALGALVAFQDYFVFPQLVRQYNTDRSIGAQRSDLPEGWIAFYVQAADPKDKVEVVRAPAQGKQRGIILLFHGNNGTVKNFFPYMKAFARSGYTVYQQEFRGYGRSSGWPSMRAFQDDAELTLGEIGRREGLAPEEITPMGISIGTGVATHLAAKTQSKRLFLIAPYTTLKSAATNKPFLGFFADLMWNDLDSRANIAELKRTCIVDVHGTSDRVIPYSHSDELQHAYTGSGAFTLLVAANSDHNDAFWEAEGLFFDAAERCAL